MASVTSYGCQDTTSIPILNFLAHPLFVTSADAWHVFLTVVSVLFFNSNFSILLIHTYVKLYIYL